MISILPENKDRKEPSKSKEEAKVDEIKLKLMEAQASLSSKHSKKSRPYYNSLSDFYDYLHDNNIVEPLVVGNLHEAEDGVTIKEFDKITPDQIIRQNNKRAFLASKIAFTWNFLLLASKIAACIFSGSISMISSTIDSAVDILSSAITFFTNYRIRRLDVYKHPQGKTRMIPLSVVVISVIMSITSLQVIIESFKRIVTGENLVPEFSYVVIGIVIATIISKAVLYIYCSSIDSTSSQILAQDSRNDVLTNLMVLIGLVLSRYAWKYGDTVCAIIISSYVLYSWAAVGSSHLSLLVGKTAPPHALQLYGWVCLLHDPKHILYITTLRAYSFGNRYLLEVDIVLSADMPLKMAHDIGETLQQKLEALPDIERAFVHLDFEKDHNPLLEHKLGIMF